MPLNLFAFRLLFMGQKTMTKSVYLKFKCLGMAKFCDGHFGALLKILGE